MVLAALLLVLLLSQPAGSHVTAYTAGQPVLNSVVVYGDTRTGTAIHQGIVNQMIPLRPDAVFSASLLLDICKFLQVGINVAGSNGLESYSTPGGPHNRMAGPQ
jgi:hypothetical protein